MTSSKLFRNEKVNTCAPLYFVADSHTLCRAPLPFARRPARPRLSSFWPLSTGNTSTLTGLGVCSTICRYSSLQRKRLPVGRVVRQQFVVLRVQRHTPRVLQHHGTRHRRRCQEGHGGHHGEDGVRVKRHPCHPEGVDTSSCTFLSGLVSSRITALRFLPMT